MTRDTARLAGQVTNCVTTLAADLEEWKGPADPPPGSFTVCMRSLVAADEQAQAERRVMELAEKVLDAKVQEMLREALDGGEGKAPIEQALSETKKNLEAIKEAGDVRRALIEDSISKIDGYLGQLQAPPAKRAQGPVRSGADKTN